MASSSMKYVQLYFDSNGIANFQYEDSMNETRYAMYSRKTTLSYVKQSLNEWIPNSSLSTTKIENKCFSIIDPSYLIAILLGIMFLFALSILNLSLARQRRRCIIDTQILAKSNDTLEFQERFFSEDEIQKHKTQSCSMKTLDDENI